METLQPLYLLQKRALKIISFLPLSSRNSSNLFTLFNIQSVYQLHKTHVAIFMYDWYQRCLPISIQGIVQATNRINYPNTRRMAGGAPNLPKASTNFIRHSISFTGPKLWESISDDIKLATNKQIFKNKIKKLLANIGQPWDHAVYQTA